MEIERKFLVEDPPLADAASSAVIRQGYLAIDKDRGAAVRIRREDDKYTLTAKTSTDQGLIARNEVEIEITEEQFVALWPLTVGNQVHKTRFKFAANGPLVYEVDYFDHGLKLAEVEFPTLEDARAFTPPSWFGKEVTDDPRFANTWISKHGNPLTAQTGS
jgi:CYTH domain-containing protein